MDHEARMTQLYDKMAAEQTKFREWLALQPPEEILNHAYEYTVREDILMCMEEAELRPEQTEALLASASPLDDVYQVYSKMETSHMETVRESIEAQADTLLLARQETPLYRQPASYAREHGELEQYRASHKANIACKNAVETAINDNFDGLHLRSQAALDVLEQFGPQRTCFVLANTVQLKDWDLRFSPENRKWATHIAITDDGERRCDYSVESHPAVLDGFISRVRRELAMREQPGLQPHAKPSIRAQLAANAAQTARPAPEVTEEAR